MNDKWKILYDEAKKGTETETLRERRRKDDKSGIV